jgi:hypothetical protein
MALALTRVAAAAPVIELEIATERGLQITAPKEWLQLLTGIGLVNVRIRGASASDEPLVTNRGTANYPRYHVVGILTSREQLHLPGGTFGRGDAKRLKDYFDRLAADGGERLTAPRSMFGLTEKELDAVLADLSQPLGFETKGQSPQSVVDRLQAGFKHKVELDAGVDRILRDASPAVDELSNLSAGTALAILLRSNDLLLRPEKSIGKPVAFRIVRAASEPTSPVGQTRGRSGTTATPPPSANSRAGKPNDTTRTHWPIGWVIDRAPGEAAPSLFDQLNAEIDGYSLAETLAAVGPRLKVPYYLDHAMLRARGVAASAAQIKVTRARMSYQRLLEQVLAQAGLGCELRADEAGMVFLWISR